MEILGIDVGRSLVLGARLWIRRAGVLSAPRFRVPTPSPASPGQVAEAVAEDCA